MKLQSLGSLVGKFSSPLGALLVAAAIVSHSSADPIMGRDVIKFSQLPMLNTTLTSDSGFPQAYHGHDDLSTAWSTYSGGTAGQPLQFTGFGGTIMTDDFADPLSTPVVHVKWWGSYLNGPREGVQKFLISFGDGIEHGEIHLDLNQVVVKGAISPGSGTFTEKQVFPNSIDGPIYEYNAELYLGKEFEQRPNKQFSLSIAALVDIGPNQNPLTDPSVVRWGWHTRDYTVHDAYASSVNSVLSDRVVGVLAPSTNVWHFGDDTSPGDLTVQPGMNGSFIMPFVRLRATGVSLQRYQPTADGPLAIAQFARDLSFELYTVPEPASFCLLAFGSVSVAGLLGRRRS